MFNEEEQLDITTFKILKSKKKNNKFFIKSVYYNDFEITLKGPNNVVLLNNSDIVQIDSIYSSVESNDVRDIYIYWWQKIKNS